ncbi:MAG: hypothetical protein JW878_02655 [Methanomicrobia archaeon]|nr:hypothetical protein [Methanomicrobia archaeon]
MNTSVDSWSGGEYQHKMFVFSIPYFILNLLDLITTRIALATSANLRELNPLYYNPYLVPLKIFAPIILIVFYLTLYHFNRSERGRRTVEKSACYCIMAMTVLYAIICTNNLCHYVFVV